MKKTLKDIYFGGEQFTAKEVLIANVGALVGIALTLAACIIIENIF